MKNYLVLCLTFTLIACGPSQGEKEKIAAVSCAVMGETRNMDAAIRVEKMNEAREKIGGEPFLRGDDAIKEAFEYGLCEELVLSGVIYDESLGFLKDAERERKRIATEKQRIADSKPTVKEEFHPNGELKERTNYQSKDDGGKKHGVSRSWHENGQLRYETTYKDGKEHGFTRGWKENGQLRYETTYKDGKEHGLSRSWHENGQLWIETTYKDGKEYGRNRLWHENGQLRYETTYKDGKKHGFYRSWRENGQLRYENCYSNGVKVDMSNCKG
jgi:antitoxin component YwqK of YwqJK toxin-antitoxin module